MQLPNLAAVTTITQIQSNGVANTNGSHLDLQPYKGPVTVLLTTSPSSIGVGTLNVASIEDSADNTTFAVVANFSAVVNTANASNVGAQVKSFDVRDVDRYIRVRTELSGTNANIPLSVCVIGQKERV